MADKQDADSPAFPLPAWQVVEVAGRDAAAFLQAQTMNDVAQLTPGSWQWNGWLNPKGRLIALFAVVSLAAEEFRLIVPDYPAPELVARLQRFVFRSKVRLLLDEDSRCHGRFAPPEIAKDSTIDVAADSRSTQMVLDLGTASGARTLCVVTGDLAGAESAEQARRWDAFDLAHGLPRLTLDQSEAWTPQMLSLERLRAFSLKKGCYPGQEIVARTHYLGQAKRTLARIAGERLTVGADVTSTRRVLGSVVSSIGDQALAVLAADRPNEDWECAGAPSRELPLLDGLAR